MDAILGLDFNINLQYYFFQYWRRNDLILNFESNLDLTQVIIYLSYVIYCPLLFCHCKHSHESSTDSCSRWHLPFILIQCIEIDRISM